MGFAYTICIVVCVFIHYELRRRILIVPLSIDRARFEYTNLLVCHATQPARHLWMLVPPLVLRAKTLLITVQVLVRSPSTQRRPWTDSMIGFHRCPMIR
jgi:hypothetical protein